MVINLFLFVYEIGNLILKLFLKRIGYKLDFRVVMY